MNYPRNTPTVSTDSVAQDQMERVERIEAEVKDLIIEDNEPADREHITGSVGKEFPNNEPAPPATPEESGGPSAGEGAGVALPADTPPAANTNFRRIKVLGSINE